MTNDEPTRVMLDLETLGTDPGCVILSIGAVRFDSDGPTDDEFHKSISLASCTDAGLEIDVGTLEWWLGQDEAAREVLTGGHDLRETLHGFQTWYQYADPDEIWAFSPSFDCAILEAAYEAVDYRVPWSYRDERCARTLAALPGAVRTEGEADETHHDALDDARWQARNVSATLRAISDSGGET